MEANAGLMMVYVDVYPDSPVPGARKVSTFREIKPLTCAVTVTSGVTLPMLPLQILHKNYITHIYYIIEEYYDVILRIELDH